MTDSRAARSTAADRPGPLHVMTPFGAILRRAVQATPGE